MLTIEEVVPAFLMLCPSIAATWQEYLEFWGGEAERGHYNDAAIVAQHLVESFERRELSEYPAAFAFLERCLVEGDEQAKELAAVGIIEGIQNVASHRTFGAGVFYELLGPVSRTAWNELCEAWRQLAEAKAAGLLEFEGSAPAAPLPDPSQIQDAALRSIVERLYRQMSNVESGAG